MCLGLFAAAVLRVPAGASSLCCSCLCFDSSVETTVLLCLFLCFFVELLGSSEVLQLSDVSSKPVRLACSLTGWLMTDRSGTELLLVLLSQARLHRCCCPPELLSPSGVSCDRPLGSWPSWEVQLGGWRRRCDLPSLPRLGRSRAPTAPSTPRRRTSPTRRPSNKMEDPRAPPNLYPGSGSTAAAASSGRPPAPLTQRFSSGLQMWWWSEEAAWAVRPSTTWPRWARATWSSWRETG